MKDEEEIYREIDRAMPFLEETLAALKLKRLNSTRLSREFGTETIDEDNLEAAIRHLIKAQDGRIPF
jgi:hypothetical protein